MQPVEENSDKRPIGQDSIDVEKLLYDTRERLKELSAINETTSIIKKDLPIQETLQEICQILPKAWQYPDDTVARVRFDEMEFVSGNFRETEWKQEQPFETIDNLSGTLEIFYLKDLGADCAQDHVYEFFFCAPPLPITRPLSTPLVKL